MTNIPSNLARVSNTLSAQIMLDALQRTQRGLLDTEIQLATGQRVNRASDDALATSLISVLDDVVERRDQWLRNLSHADAVLNNVDAAVADATDLLIEAKGIASSQIGVGSDEETRRAQGAVIDSMVNQLIAVANRQFQQVHLFGGDATATSPMLELLGGIRYQGEGDGLANDVGLHSPLRITLSGNDVFGALSTRVEGNFDLEPTMVGSTRLADLNGARGLGVTLGEINVDVNGTDITVDLSTTHTVQDVIDTLQTAIRTVDALATVQIDGVTGYRFEILPSLGPITITDLTGATTAADLGLDITFPGGGRARRGRRSEAHRADARYESGRGRRAAGHDPDLQRRPDPGPRSVRGDQRPGDHQRRGESESRRPRRDRRRGGPAQLHQRALRRRHVDRRGRRGGDRLGAGCADTGDVDAPGGLQRRPGHPDSLRQRGSRHGPARPGGRSRLPNHRQER
jgi:flagellar hook-associated protein 3 FlgL